MDWGLIGNAWAVRLLQRQLQRGTLHHAYLIAGPEGIGREALATALAQAVLCEQPPAAGTWCGECRACRGVPAGGTPDLHRVEREEGKQGIAIEQVRELQRQLALTPLGSRGRVALLIDFDRASEGAANALLKTLEEPAGRVVLVLTAADVDSVPATIASRCETLTLRPVPPGEMTAALVRAGTAPDRARRIVEASDGRPSLAWRLLAEPDLLERRSGHRQALEEAMRLDLAGRFALVEAWHGDEELEERLGVWISVLRQSLRRALSSEQGGGTAVPGLESLPAGAQRAALGAALEASEAIQRNANARLALEALMLELPGL